MESQGAFEPSSFSSLAGDRASRFMSLQNGVLTVRPLDQRHFNIEIVRRGASIVASVSEFEAKVGNTTYLRTHSKSFSAASVRELVLRGNEATNEIANLTALPARILGFGGDDELRGGSGIDLIWGGNGDDQIWGGLGADQIRGEAGNDVIRAGAGNDFVDGGAGNDRMLGEAGDDRIYGGAGVDRCWGGAGNDRIVTGDGNDAAYGDDGNDRIELGTGNDRGWGGAGNDQLFGADGRDELDGEAGIDWLDAGSGNDRVFGGSGNDRLYGREHHDILQGGTGNDVLLGGDGDDTLHGGDGDDLLYGERGRDGLIGMRGKDRLSGGIDADRYLIYATDTLVDEQSEDMRFVLRDGVTRTVTEGFQEMEVAAGRWDEHEAVSMDRGLKILQSYGGAFLIRLEDRRPIVLTRYGTPVVFGAAAQFFAADDIAFYGSSFSGSGQKGDREVNTIMTLIHEIGHRFQTLDPGFLELSNWTETSSGWVPFTFNNFAEAYGKTNPYEDYATCFAAIFLHRAGLPYERGPGYSAIPDKAAWILNDLGIG
ncbi:MAG TPA: hypothetical protein DCQ98_14530 [Planctomycetaceae bacterium]|nr:hypothetical protein [Planctomycetaceae bacterium]HRE99328.1 hypothetical protein [Pirellulaceae bacterium]